MFGKLFGRFSRDIGIDLGTVNTLLYVKDKGVVIDEPSVVAINSRTNRILAVGIDAEKMVGKTPPHIVASKPLIGGVVSDFEVCEKMVKFFIDKVSKGKFGSISGPRIVVSIPLDITEVEKKAVEDAVLSAGAREVYLVEQPLLAAIGARLPIQSPTGYLLVDVGGGTTDIAVISLGGIVTFRALKVAGNELNTNIVKYARENFNLLLGEKIAEDIKKEIGSAVELSAPLEMAMKGRDLLTGLPKEIMISDSQVREAMAKTIRIIVDNIKIVIENTPPELVADIYERGITLSGGGSLLRGLDRLIAKEIKTAVTIVDDPLMSVVKGTGIVLDDDVLLKEVRVQPS